MVKRLVKSHPVHKAGVNACNPGVDGLQFGQQGLNLVRSQGVAALKVHQGGHHGGGAFGHGEGAWVDLHASCACKLS